jgi:hypothetical protein
MGENPHQSCLAICVELSSKTSKVHLLKFPHIVVSDEMHTRSPWAKSPADLEPHACSFPI